MELDKKKSLNQVGGDHYSKIPVLKLCGSEIQKITLLMQ